jgi:hypothetical protein
LNSFTLQGSVPEPIRVAKLAARSSFSLLLWFEIFYKVPINWRSFNSNR